MSNTIIEQIEKIVEFQDGAMSNMALLAQASKTNSETIDVVNGNIGKVVNSMEKTVDLITILAENTQQNFVSLLDLTRSIIDRLIYLYRLSGYIIFIITMLTWKVFLQEPLNSFFSSVITWWPKLSEGWQICILTIISSIPVGILIIIGGHIAIKRLFGEKTKK